MDCNCLQCGSRTFGELAGVFDTRFGIDAPYEIRQCAQCGLEQTAPVPTAAELKELYEEFYNFGGGRSAYTDLRAKFYASKLYSLWLAIDGDVAFHGRLGSGRLLDVGCNEGRGLARYARNGFSVEGLELNDKAAQAAREQGFVVYSELLGDFEPTERYDVVVLSNVLEHSLDPKEMLRDVHRVLKPGGQVWISCPNAKSWLRSVFGKFWINWHVPFHIVHFSAGTLERMLQDAGFAVRVERNETPALWGAHSVIARLYSLQGKPTRQLRNPLLVMGLIALCRGIFFPLLWIFNRIGRGDCLVVIAEKVTDL